MKQPWNRGGATRLRSRLACALLCIALPISSWPARALSTTAQLRAHPERFLLRHADELGLAEFARVALHNSARGAPAGGWRAAPPAAAGFDARLLELAERLDRCADAIERSGELGDSLASVHEALAEVETQFGRALADAKHHLTLWRGGVRERQVELLHRIEQRMDRVRSAVTRLDAWAAAGDPADPAREAVRAETAWIRSLRPHPATRVAHSGDLAFRVRAPTPIDPATTRSDLEAQLGLAPRAGLAATAAAAAPPAAEDLDETPEIQFTAEVQALASSLNGNPVAIFEWVRNNIDFAPVWGSIQGADHCLQTRICNDTDTASLLIALLRSAGIPSRYVLGTVDVFEADARSWLGGAETLSVAGQIAASGGIPGVIFNNDRLRIERVWVQALVDMNPSRGAVQVAGDTWVDLDPGFKRHEFPSPVALPTSFDPIATLNALESSTTVDPVTSSVTSADTAAAEAQIQSELDTIAAELLAAAPGQSTDSIIGAPTIEPVQRSALPGTLPFEVVAATAPIAELPSSLRHTLTLRVLDEFGFSVASATRSLPELAGHSLALAYVAATPADQAAIEALLPDSLPTPDDLPTSVPAGSIQLIPELRAGTELLAAGGPVGVGAPQSLEVVFGGPFGTRSFVSPSVVGSYVALGLDLQRVGDAQLDEAIATHETVAEMDTASAEFQALTAHALVGSLLQSGILNWFREIDTRSEQLAVGNAVVWQRLPSSGTYRMELAVSTMFGIPVAVANGGTLLDIPNVFSHITARNGDTQLAVSTALAQGQLGSEFEAGVQETILSETGAPVQAMSTMRILRAANDQGIPVYRIDASNSSAILPLLQYGASDLNLIAAQLSAGREVIVPERPIAFGGSALTGLIAQDIGTGSAAYLISGGFGVASGGLADWLTAPGTSVFLLMILGLASIVGLVLGVSLVSLVAAVVSVGLSILSFMKAREAIESSGLAPEDQSAFVSAAVLFALVIPLAMTLFGLSIATFSAAATFFVISIYLGMVLIFGTALLAVAAKLAAQMQPPPLPLVWRRVRPLAEATRGAPQGGLGSTGGRA